MQLLELSHCSSKPHLKLPFGGQTKHRQTIDFLGLWNAFVIRNEPNAKKEAGLRNHRTPPHYSSHCLLWLMNHLRQMFLPLSEFRTHNWKRVCGFGWRVSFERALLEPRNLYHIFFTFKCWWGYIIFQSLHDHGQLALEKLIQTCFTIQRPFFLFIQVGSCLNLKSLSSNLNWASLDHLDFSIFCFSGWWPHHSNLICFWSRFPIQCSRLMHIGRKSPWIWKVKLHLDYFSRFKTKSIYPPLPLITYTVFFMKEAKIVKGRQLNSLDFP